MGVSITHISEVLDVMAIKDPLAITPEEDEEQMIMRRLRNSCDELKRGYRWLDYRMQRVKQKAEQSKEQRETIELPEEKVSVRGEPIPFKAYIPMDEVIQYRKDQKAWWWENGVQGDQA